MPERTVRDDIDTLAKMLPDDAARDMLASVFKHTIGYAVAAAVAEIDERGIVAGDLDEDGELAAEILSRCARVALSCPADCGVPQETGAPIKYRVKFIDTTSGTGPALGPSTDDLHLAVLEARKYRLRAAAEGHTWMLVCVVRA